MRGSFHFYPFLQKDGIDPRQALEQAENELRLSQVEFDRQVTEIRLRFLSTKSTTCLLTMNAPVLKDNIYLG